MIQVFGYAVGIAAQDTRCADGPKALYAALSQNSIDLPLRWHPLYSTTQKNQQLTATPIIADLCTQLGEHVQSILHSKETFITIGGDHSCAIGSWSGAAAALHTQGDVGLIWFDAHMDSHTPQTTPSKNIHGMPLAVLLGYGDTQLTHILSPQPKLKPENIAIIGVRSFEAGEDQLLKKLGVRVFNMDEINEKGMLNVMQMALEIVTKNTAGFGISIDLDGLDPLDAPGVGSPVKDGVRASDFIKALEPIPSLDQFIGADIAEFNPHLDKNNQTEKIVIEILKIMTQTR